MRVAAGFFSFTEITEPGAHAAYNAWHMLDHVPEQFALGGVRYGQRWVLTPDRARAARVGAPFANTHYVTLYLLADPVAETIAEFVALGAQLRATPGRWFEARRANVSGPWRFVEAMTAPDVAIRAEVLPLRPHRAIHVQVGGMSDLDARVGEVGVLGAWRFAGGREFAADRRGGVDDDIVVTWLDDPDVAIEATDARFGATLLPITPWQWDWFEP